VHIRVRVGRAEASVVGNVSYFVLIMSTFGLISEVLVRRSDIPGGGSLAAILRYPL
jgi:hypothetical protein